MDKPRTVKTTTDSGCYDDDVNVSNDVEARSEAAAYEKAPAEVAIPWDVGMSQ